GEFSPFATDRIEQIAGLMKGIVEKFKPVCARAAKQRFISLADFRPSALDSSQRIVHCGILGIVPVLPHHAEVALIERVVELRERLYRLSLFSAIFASCDRDLDGAVGIHAAWDERLGSKDSIAPQLAERGQRLVERGGHGGDRIEQRSRIRVTRRSENVGAGA